MQLLAYHHLVLGAAPSNQDAPLKILVVRIFTLLSKPAAAVIYALGA